MVMGLLYEPFSQPCIIFLCHADGKISGVTFGGVMQPAVVEVVCKKRDRGEWGERESFAPYYVTVVTPPPRNLGIHSLPPVSTIFSDQSFHFDSLFYSLTFSPGVQTDFH
jgi:hypothetical protein